MKALIVYDSVSSGRNTEKIAKIIADTLMEKGVEAECLFAKDADKAVAKSCDCLIAGSPTMAWTATIPVKEFLEAFEPNEFSGKWAAAFDTRVKSRFSGTAVKGLEKRLKKLGFKTAMPSLATYVEGSSTQNNDYVLKDGELEKAKKYAADLAKIIQP